MDHENKMSGAGNSKAIADVIEQLHNDNAKRLKTENDSLEKSDSSKESEHSADCEASTSTSDSGFNRSKIAKTRNYRKFSKDDESSNNESTHEDDLHEESADSALNLSSTSANPESDDSLLLDSFNTSNTSTMVVPDSNSESEEEHPVLKKTKPRHNWFVVPELIDRQRGTSSKKQSSALFQRRCYGSLHCVQRLELMYKLEKHAGCVNSLNFHPNGELLASGSDDLNVVLWDWKNGKPLMSFETKHRLNVFQSKFLPLNGDLHIVTCARDGQVRLAQVSALEGLRSSRKLGVHRGPCHKLSVLHDQPQIVISVGEDGVVLRHDLRNPKSETVLTVTNESHEVALYSISSHPLNTNEFCVAGKDHIVRSYDLRMPNDRTLKTYHPFKKKVSNSLHVTCAVYNHDGSEILASYNDEDIYLFDVNSTAGSFIHHYQGHRNGATIKGVNFFGPKSEFVVSGSDCGYVYFWEKNTESIVQWLLADDNGVVNCIEPHPELPFLCTSGLDYDVKVWVPSYEQEPKMDGLARTVKNNLKARSQWSYSNDMDDTQVLWMLWRHLSGNDQIRRVFHFAMENSAYRASPDNTSSSSSSNNSSNTDADSDDDNSDGPAGCTTS